MRGFDSPEHAQWQRTEAGVKTPAGRREVAEQRKSRPWRRPAASALCSWPRRRSRRTTRRQEKTLGRGSRKTPLPNGVPRSGGSMDGAGVEPTTTRSKNGGGAGTADPHGGLQQMGDDARSADARSLPEFWSPGTRRSWMLAMCWSTGVRGRRGGGRGGAIGGERREGR